MFDDTDDTKEEVGKVEGDSEDSAEGSETPEAETETA